MTTSIEDFSVTVAILDSSGALVGLERTEDPTGRVIVVDEVDLPLNGTYKWDPRGSCFVPLGHGFGRPQKPPVSDAYALFSVVQSLGDAAPQPARLWAAWFRDNVQRREEEGILARSRKQKG